MRAVFLDRDGVINRDRPEGVKAWDEFDFIPGAVAGLRRLHEAGFSLVVVSNQSLVGRGVAPAEAVRRINERMNAALKKAGAGLCGVYVCPHAPEENCSCRKPKPGLIIKAAQELGLDLNGAWVIGDDVRDIQAGQALGLRTILVRTGKGAQVEGHPAISPEAVVDDLAAAADYVLSSPKPSQNIN